MFFCQNSTFTQDNSLRSVTDFLALFSVFVNPDSGLLQIGRKLEKWYWHGMTSSSISFGVFFFFFLLLLSSLVTGPSLMSISFLVLKLWQFLFIKGLTRIPKIGNTPVWVLLNIWRLGRVRNTKFGTSVSNKMLLNPAKCQGYSFWVIKGKPTGGEGRGKIAPHTQIWVN